MNEKAVLIIEQLGLLPHPEGGFYKEIYRSKESLKKEALPERFVGERNFSTSIYFLLANENKSHFHKIKSDEIWHFYSGSALILHMIDSTGNYESIKVGNDFDKNENPQIVIPHGVWFAAEVEDKNSYSLVGCTVSPGFDFQDFELAKKENLLAIFPMHEKIINEFTMPETT